VNQVAKTDRRRRQRTSSVCAQAAREPAGFAKGQKWPRTPSALSGSRQAFTLIEVILAVALSLVLVLAIGSAVDLYRRMTTAAQDDLSEMRLVRAVFNKFENDIRSVVPPQPIGSSGTTASSTASSGSSSSSSSGSSGSSSSGSSGSSSGSSSSSASSTSSNQTDPFQYVYSRSVFGLFGDGASLVLDTLTPHRMPLITQSPIGTQTGSQSSGQPNTDPSNLAGIHGDMKVISYFVLGEGTSSILPTGAGSGQLTPEGKAMTSGLARLEGDRTAIGYAMETSSTSSMSARIIAPEVQSVAFRYFDGTNWVQSWSGATAQALPTAVEIVITVNGANDPYGARTQADRERPSRTYRHVVAITSTAPPQLISEQTINSTSANMSQ
jgi:prepilin-type N-terminal cleavage/methylation domain-containing protein